LFTVKKLNDVAVLNGNVCSREAARDCFPCSAIVSPSLSYFE
jgi:hypothetical protein